MSAPVPATMFADPAPAQRLEWVASTVIFEPALVTGRPLVGENYAVITQARDAIATGNPGTALAIFMAGHRRSATVVTVVPWLWH